MSEQPFYPPLTFTEPYTDKQLREIVFGAVARDLNEYYDTIPQFLVDEFLLFIQNSYPDEYERIIQKHREDLQVLTARWKYEQYTKEEAGKHDIHWLERWIIGLDYMICIDFAIGSVAEGVDLALKYGFSEGAEHIVGKRNHGTGTKHLFVIETRCVGDGILFLGGNEGIPDDVYTVGFVWGPQHLMEKFRVYEFKSLPGY